MGNVRLAKSWPDPIPREKVAEKKQRESREEDTRAIARKYWAKIYLKRSPTEIGIRMLESLLEYKLPGETLRQEIEGQLDAALMAKEWWEEEAEL